MNTNRYHHLSWLHGIGLFEARLSDQEFSRHSHAGFAAGFAIGAITQGVGGYLCRGENLILPPGTLSLMNPEEAHTGTAHSHALRYNMMYVSEDAVRSILGIKHLRDFQIQSRWIKNLTLAGHSAGWSSASTALKGLDGGSLLKRPFMMSLRSASNVMGGYPFALTGTNLLPSRQRATRSGIRSVEVATSPLANWPVLSALMRAI